MSVSTGFHCILKKCAKVQRKQRTFQLHSGLLDFFESIFSLMGIFFFRCKNLASFLRSHHLCTWVSHWGNCTQTNYFLPLKTPGNSANVFMVTFSLSTSSRMGLDPKYKKFIKEINNTETKWSPPFCTSNSHNGQAIQHALALWPLRRTNQFFYHLMCWLIWNFNIWLCTLLEGWEFYLNSTEFIFWSGSVSW